MFNFIYIFITYMFNYFLITVWIEYNNKIYSKVLPELFNGCETHVEKIYKQVKPPLKVKAIKCDDTKRVS